jgi:mono/diheme cytochrome c family protein/plastocyanin
MTDQQPGPVPVPSPEERLPVPREPAEASPAERFTAPPQAHSFGLSPERAAKIIRQSGSSRWIAFLAVTVVVVFVIGYYFYELGVPGIGGSSRMEKETAAQQVTAVERGATLFTANCSRCHGATGGGGIGPVLNDQAKLLTHLTPQYLATVLTVGGRYVCGNPASLMLAWLEPKGPLNYRQVEELIAFIRAPSTLTYTTKDAATGATTEMTGWRDESYAMPAGATPVPDCWKDAFAAPGASSAPGASAAPSGAPTAAPSGGSAVVQLKLTASGIAYDTDSLEVPANTPFQIVFTNNDAGIPHNVAIHKDSPTGELVWQGEIFPGVETRTYDVPALPAGTYGFVCTVHPNMTGTLTAK